MVAWKRLYTISGLLESLIKSPFYPNKQSTLGSDSQCLPSENFKAQAFQMHPPDSAVVPLPSSAGLGDLWGRGGERHDHSPDTSQQLNNSQNVRVSGSVGGAYIPC